jgi:ABC-type transporter Mla MlaB component
MIVQQPGAPGEARVIGSLTGDGIQILLDAVDSGVVVLDLSEVDRVDDSAVSVLAGLWPERCKIQNCPRWLDLWLIRVRGCDSNGDD